MAPPTRQQKSLAFENPFAPQASSSSQTTSALSSRRKTKPRAVIEPHATPTTALLDLAAGSPLPPATPGGTASNSSSTNIDLKTPLIIDLGSFNAKIGFSTDAAPRRVLNAIVKAKSEKKRQFVGNELEQQCLDLHGLYFINPINNGFICNWETQIRLFDYFFSPDMLNITPTEHELVLTESFINMHNRRKTLMEVLFEYYEFPSVMLTFPELLSGITYQTNKSKTFPHYIIADIGHEAISFMPFVNMLPTTRYAKRLDVGGKKLTNLLMHALSFRYFNVLDCWWTVNHMKEHACYIAGDFREEVRKCEAEIKNSALDSKNLSDLDQNITRYVTLPDYVTYRQPQIRTRREQAEMRRAGKVTRDDQVVPLCVECIEIGECLFEPRQIGSAKLGLAKACSFTANQFEYDEKVQISMLHNIVLTGGGANMPGICERLQKDLTRLSPTGDGVEYVRVFRQDSVNDDVPIDPIDSAWYGGKTLLTSPKWKDFYESTKVKKFEWQEQGYDRLVAAGRLSYVNG